MRKKGQITIFLVLAFGLIFVVFFVLSLAAKVKTSQLENEAQEIVDNMLSKSTMENYITSCLNSVSRDGIFKLSTQGGRILPNQKGSLFTENIDYITYFDKKSKLEYNVSYAILREDDDFPFIYPCPFIPSPYDKFYDTSCGVKELESSGFLFNEYYQRTGCMYSSSNENSIYDTCKFGDLFLPRLDFLDNSLKLQLENYITSNFLDCINLDFFNNTLDYDIEFDIPKVKVSFGDEDVAISLNFPISVNINGKIGHAYTNYEANIPTRLKTLYKKVIYSRNSPFKAEVRKPANRFFPELRNFFASSNLKFKATIKHGVKGVDDLLIIEDELNKYSGNPDLFLFSIQNRPPVLDYINNSEDLHFDLKISPMAGITLLPIANDPDDDQLIYTYQGWKADYDCVYDSITSSCNKVDISFENMWKNPIDETLNYNRTSGASILKLTDQDKECQDHLGIGTCPYTQDINGVKYFSTIINVSDGALNDYQELLIHLESNSILPEPEIIDVFNYTLSNSAQLVYDSFSGKVVSLEDPFKLIQKGSSVLSAKLQWEFVNKPYLFTTISSCVLLPNQILCNLDDEEIDDSYFNIENIKSNSNTEILDMLDYFDELQPLVISESSPIRLTTNPDIPSLLEVSEDYDVSLVECIPHRSNNPSWPYNLNDNPFLANHTCCTDNFQYKDSSEICFKGDQLICGDRNSVNIDERDDILKKTITASCTGDRGNICDSSTAISESVSFKSCGVKNPGDIASCSACTTNVSLFEKPLSPTSNCEYFDKGDSFEKDVLYLIDSSLLDSSHITEILDGFCNVERKCSPSPGSNSYGPDKTGGLLCQGMCDPLTGQCTYATNCFCSKDFCLDTIPDECNNIVPPKKLESCTKAGMPYFKDECKTSCAMGDVENIFSCKDPLIDLDTDCTHCNVLCDSKSQGDYVPVCSEGRTYFADVCSAEGNLEDANDAICRGESYDPISGSCTASSQCDGWIVGVPFDQPYVDSETGDVSLFAAVCNSECEYDIADPVICRRGEGIYANNVDPICDGRQPNTPIGCDGGIFSLICDDSCQVVEDPEKICRHGGTSCQASFGCDERKPLTSWSSDSYVGNEKGCNQLCQLLDCSTSYGGYNFNPDTGECYNSFSLLNDHSTEKEQRAIKYCNNPDSYEIVFGFERCK